ncbi:MAG: hypothetical protein R3E94_16470 [Burkholderiaceae bacterium]
MSKLRHTLQLLHGVALSTRQIGAALGISKSTVSEIASYARVAGVDWALAQSLSNDELQARLYKPPVARESRHLEPDHAHIHRELRRPGVTLQLLWEKYQHQHAGQSSRRSVHAPEYERNSLSSCTPSPENVEHGRYSCECTGSNNDLLNICRKIF